jgi:hypothetical protein
MPFGNAVPEESGGIIHYFQAEITFSFSLISSPKTAVVVSLAKNF